MWGAAQGTYNAPFPLIESKQALRSSKSSAPCHDAIHYDMLKHFHVSMQELVLDLLAEFGRQVIYQNHGEWVLLFCF